MLDFQPVRPDFEECLVAHQLFRGITDGWQWQTNLRIILDFFQQSLHARISCE